MAFPTFVAKGTFQSGTAGLTQDIPATTKLDDLIIILVETAAQSITAPTGWTQVPNSPQTTGTAAVAGGVSIQAFYKIATTNPEPSVAIPDSGDHTTSISLVYRGVDINTPIQTAAGSVDAAATTALTWPTVTTTNAQSLVLLAMGNDTDLASTATASTYTNANLASITERHDQTVIAGAGGGIVAVDGQKSTAGATGTTTGTGSASNTHAYLSIVINPIPAPTGTVSGFAQYLSDRRTPVPIGGESTGDGIVNNLYLQMLVNNTNNLTTDNNTSVEVRPIGTSFSNTATHSAISFMAKSNDLPTARRGATLSYDAKNDRFLAIGGYDGTTRFNELYEIDGTGISGKWRLLSPTGTPPTTSNLGTATAITLNNKTWLVYWGGNIGASDSNQMLICDVSTRGSEAWTTVTQTTPLTARSYITHHLVAVPTSTTTADLYLFGGWATARENTLVKTTLNMASTVPTALTWTTVTASGAAGSPSARSGTFMWYDPALNRLMLHAGYNGTTMLNDLWQYSLTTPGWTQLSPTGTAPTGRELMSGGYDPVSKRLVIFGGWTGAAANTGLNDIYQIDFSSSSSGVFTQLKSHDYPDCDIFPFSSGAAAYDSDRRLIIEWGQNGYDGTDKYLYAFDFTDTVVAGKMTLYGHNVVDWQRARDAPAYCVNTSSGEGLLINGFSGMPDDTLAANALNGDHMNEIWAYNFANNTMRYANSGACGIPYKEGVMAVYDSINDRVITFGGLTGATQVCGGTWELKRDVYGNYAARKMFPTGTPPAPRWLGAIGFDSVNNRVIVWGGTTASAMQDTNLHILDLSGGGDGVWSSVVAGGTTPPVVWQPGYAKDTTNNRLYVTSGATNFGATTFSTRTDYLNMSLATPAWTNVNTTGITGVRGGVLMYAPFKNTFDPAYLYFFGGYNGTVVNNQFFFLDATASTPAWNGWGVTNTPVARRSAGAWVDTSGTDNVLYITSGRPVTGQWNRDVKSYFVDFFDSAASQSWTNKAPAVYEHDSVKVTGLSMNTRYHWQALNTISGTTWTGAFGGNAETATDFAIVGPVGTLTYSRNGEPSLPTTSADEAIPFTTTDYTSAASTNTVYVDELGGTTYNVFVFKERNANNTQNITGTWVGKTNVAGSSRTIFLQIWNVNTSLWETIASNSSVAANTNFTLTGTISTNVANYYDPLNITTFRVYQ